MPLPMRFPEFLTLFGDQSYRGDCPPEDIEQINFMSQLALAYPQYRRLAIHPRNEGRRSWGQIEIQKKDGSINDGASDIIIPGNRTFVCELKRLDHTKSTWQKGQQEYLEEAFFNGCFVCVALGADAAMQAVNVWHEHCLLMRNK